jgi:putative methyltransferase (TIGR04325 family)
VVEGRDGTLIAARGGGRDSVAFEGPIWEGVYESFRDVPSSGPGFDGETWIANSLTKLADLRAEAERCAPLPPPANHRECLLPILAAVVRGQRGRCRILDFGGGVGITYCHTVYGLGDCRGVEYHVVERPSVCAAARKAFEAYRTRIEFLEELPRASERYDIVHVGSSIHYVEDWRTLLSELARRSCRYVLLVDVPAGNIPTFATAQRYHESLIPVWFFNIAELVDVVLPLGFDLCLSLVFPSLMLGREMPLPMDDFEARYRLAETCNLLFGTHGGEAAAAVHDQKGAETEERHQRSMNPKRSALSQCR